MKTAAYSENSEIPEPANPSWGLWCSIKRDWIDGAHFEDRMRVIWLAKMWLGLDGCEVLIVALKTNPTGYNRFRVTEGNVETIAPENPA